MRKLHFTSGGYGSTLQALMAQGQDLMTAQLTLASNGLFSIDSVDKRDQRALQEAYEARLETAYAVLGLDRRREYAQLNAKASAQATEGIWGTSTGAYGKLRDARDAEVLEASQVPCSPDLRVILCGTVTMVEPVTQAAKDWVEDNVQVPSWAWMGGGFAVEPRLVDALVNGAVDAGLEVA